MRAPNWQCGVLALFVFLSNTSGATYFVAQRNPTASDDSAGTAEQPWKSISKATREVVPGDIVMVSDGVYRETIVISTNGTAEKPIRFQAAQGAHVLVTGADRFTTWKHVEGGRPVYVIPWSERFIGWSSHMTHPDDEYHRLIGRCEQVSVDNYLLHQVLETNQMAPGTFCADTSHQLLYLWDYANRDPNKLLVEAATRQELLRVQGEYVHVRGFHFRFAANMAQHGAVVLAGSHDVLEDCVAEAMNSSGATFSGEHQVVRRCTFRDNGQIGFGANGAHELLFSECLVENNNLKGFDRGWEAGGNKLVLCRDAVLERSRFVRNRGNGIWFDIGNEHCTVRQCFIADNEDSGIFDEISYGLRVHDNVISGNGFACTAGAWGAQAGIVLSSSPDSAVERNLIVGNREGFNFREQNRTTPRIGQRAEVQVWNHDELIRNNVIAFNRDAQIWGWFDMKDGRQWPGTGANLGNQFSSVNGSERWSLEKLNLKFANNIYFAAPGQSWFEWGVFPGASIRTIKRLAGFKPNCTSTQGAARSIPAFWTLSPVITGYFHGPVRHCVRATHGEPYPRCCLEFNPDRTSVAGTPAGKSPHPE